PALLYLAIRAARRALAVNPGDAQTCLVLGESYLRLLHNTRERAWSRCFPELAELRRIQASAALNQAIALKPEFAQAHLNLGWLYREMGYYDLALKHLRAHLKSSREAGPPPGLRAEQFREQLTEYEQQLNRLAEPVESQESAYAAVAGGLR